MGTTNILDLNNRLTKVEKENVAQNNYNSLKNRPKINGNLLTGDKTGAQLGLAESQDIADINTAIGNMSDLSTTATNLVGAINEVNEDTGWIQIESSGVSYRKIGSMVTLRGTTQSSSGWTTLCTLPSNIRPASDIMRAIRALSDYATLYITQSGDVNVQSNVSAQIGFQESFLIG